MPPGPKTSTERGMALPPMFVVVCGRSARAVATGDAGTGVPGAPVGNAGTGLGDGRVVGEGVFVASADPGGAMGVGPNRAPLGEPPGWEGREKSQVPLLRAVVRPLGWKPPNVTASPVTVSRAML